jgi:hypothetical protein
MLDLKFEAVSVNLLLIYFSFWVGETAVEDKPGGLVCL